MLETKILFGNFSSIYYWTFHIIFRISIYVFTRQINPYLVSSLQPRHITGKERRGGVTAWLKILGLSCLDDCLYTTLMTNVGSSKTRGNNHKEITLWAFYMDIRDPFSPKRIDQIKCFYLYFIECILIWWYDFLMSKEHKYLKTP